MYEYGTLKPVEAVLKRGREKREIMEEMNQTCVHCTYVWKCHNNTPCTAIIY
jgi:hypothetical protein